MEKVLPNIEIAPVVLLVFNRPQFLARLLDVLRAVRPSTVLVVADGPRPNVPADVVACAAVHDLIARGIDWPAQVLINRSETNLGLRKRISSGLTWAFEQVDHAIILEDDCLPHPTFFRFCTELLAYYENENRIGHISGTSARNQLFDCGASYYFSSHPKCWGWATWRRAWRFYDDEMKDWPRLRAEGGLRRTTANPEMALRRERNFDRAHGREIESWVFPWVYSCWRNSLLSITPVVNLVENVGFGESATHMHRDPFGVGNRRVEEMKFPLRHPAEISVFQPAEEFYQQNFVRPVKWHRRIRMWLRNRWAR